MIRPKHLIIPDPHAHPKYDNKRFTYLGKLIERERPDTIICIGDMADMPSLAQFDVGKKTGEGRRYADDIAATIDAQERLFNEIRKPRGYSPRLIMCLGNHEYRIVRAVNESPRFEGKVSLADLRYEQFGWEVIPFLQPIVLEGIAYAHYFASGVMGRGISGENIGKSLCNKLHASAVQGHSHVYDHSERAIINGLRIFGLSCGCYTHHKMIEDWNRATYQMWWRGIVILDELDGAGYYDELRTITLRKLTRDFK
jgi:hypothetical protein